MFFCCFVNNCKADFYVHDSSGIFCNIDEKENRIYTCSGFHNDKLIAEFVKLPDAYKFAVYHNNYCYRFLLNLNPISDKTEKFDDGSADENIKELKIDCMDPALNLDAKLQIVTLPPDKQFFNLEFFGLYNSNEFRYWPGSGMIDGKDFTLFPAKDLNLPQATSLFLYLYVKASN